MITISQSTIDEVKAVAREDYLRAYADEINQLKREYREAIDDEREAASRASAAADQLRDHGIDVNDL